MILNIFYFSFGTYIWFLPGWVGKKSRVWLHVSLPRRPRNQFKLFQQSIKQVLRAFFPNIYTVPRGQVAANFRTRGWSARPSAIGYLKGSSINDVIIFQGGRCTKLKKTLWLLGLRGTKVFTWYVSRVVIWPKKIFPTFDNIFHVYFIRTLQKYARNLILMMAFWEQTQTG